MSKQKVLFPKSYCRNCHRVRTNWNKDQSCDAIEFKITGLELIPNHNWEF